jgi:hypothetical protein
MNTDHRQQFVVVVCDIECFTEKINKNGIRINDIFSRIGGCLRYTYVNNKRKEEEKGKIVFTGAFQPGRKKQLQNSGA